MGKKLKFLIGDSKFGRLSKCVFTWEGKVSFESDHKKIDDFKKNIFL